MDVIKIAFHPPRIAEVPAVGVTIASDGSILVCAGIGPDQSIAASGFKRNRS
jgi:hypothetical protein